MPLDEHVPMTPAQREAQDDIPNNPSTQPTFGDIVNKRFNRRGVLRGALGVTAITALATSKLALLSPRQAEAKMMSDFSFSEISHGVDETHHVAEGYNAQVLIRWGDKVEGDAPEFAPSNQTAAAQAKQFGYNNDFVGYMPLPAGSNNSSHGLLCVNHEYTNEEVMFPGMTRQDKADPKFGKMTKDHVDIEMAAHGHSVIEVKKTGETWEVVDGSPFARRITVGTPMMISGPAAGHDRMKTSYDPTGTRVFGTINNCAGGMTPWGTILTAEENFHFYFKGDVAGHPEERNYKRYGLPNHGYDWGTYHDRFDINKEPNEGNRFGWIVEIDPYDPTSMPIKRTTMGRFKHEGATAIVNADGRVVLYSGDDQRFDYLYKFVTHGRFDPNNREANRDLLDSGTLFVAKFNDDGTLDWMPLVWGTGPLTAANGFDSQADVLIETRRAADLLEATPMDRPEDVEPNPTTNKVYVMLTNNSRRKEDQLDKVNSRAKNIWGQIAELAAPDGDHAAQRFTWEILVKCGSPKDPNTGSMWNPATSDNGWFACPDNCAIDHQGRLWITTDQGGGWKKASGTADGVWALGTEGDNRGMGKMFYRVPVGAEMCGPMFTPDDQTLFVAVQHVATDGTKHYEPFGKSSSFEDPATRWPDFKEGVPPRPSVVAITKKGGGVIGS